jgi:glucose-1-phosphate cytidylyltransferase
VIDQRRLHGFGARCVGLFLWNDTLDLEQEVLVNLARDQQLMVYRHQGFWRSMDTFKEAREMERLWQDGAPWKVWA